MEVYRVTINDKGTTIWYNEDGVYHRNDGPAIKDADGAKFWYQNGKCHRIDGPAAIYTDGRKKWYIEGLKYTEEDYNKKLNPSCEGQTVTIEGVTYKLTKV
jgi:hypothetical protein